MKKIILFTLTTLITSALFAQSKSNGYFVEKKTFSKPIEYNDYIADLITLVDNAWDKSIDAGDAKTAMSWNKELKTVTTKVLASFKKMEGYEGEISFKASAIDYVTHMNNISKKELPAFLKLIHSKKEITPDQEKKAEALLPMLDDRRESLFASMEVAQQNFANKHNFTISGQD